MVIDSSALIAMLQREVEHDAFANAVALSPVRLIGAATMFETSMVVLGRQGDQGLATLRNLLRAISAQIVPLDAHHADLALDAFRRYGKGRHRAGLNYGDCLSYALSKATGLPLLFKGDDFVHTDVRPAL